MSRAQAIAALLLFAVAGCGAYDVSLSSGPDGLAGRGTTSRSPSLVGTWTRIVFFTDAFGAAHSSRTTWEFRGDGTASRTVVTRNLSDGLADATVADAIWRTEGSTLVITFTPPDSGTVRFPFSIVGDALTLDGRVFERVR